VKKIIFCLLFLFPVLLLGQSSVSTTEPSSITGTSAISGGVVSTCFLCNVHERGVCWSTSPNPTTANPRTSDGDTDGTFTSYIGNLTPGTTYYVRAYARYSNVVETLTIYGSNYSFTTLVPNVETEPATNITSSSATSGGNVTDDHGVTVTARGVCWSTTPNPTRSGNHTVDGSGTGQFSSVITGLSPNTVYYVRAYAVYSTGTSYGGNETFTTLPALPSVTTAGIVPASITATSADGGGNVTGDGGDTVTARGVCWSNSSGPTISDSFTTDGTGTGSFTSSLTGLQAGTTYYVRAYATNSVGTAYGNQVNFTTDPDPPTVITSAVTIIDSTSVLAGGNVTDDGGGAVDYRGICWATSANPTRSVSYSDIDSGTGEFSGLITGLTEGTPYYVRAYAHNSSGIVYGNNATFTIPPDLPSLTTVPVTAITTSTASSGGSNLDDNGWTISGKGVCWSTLSSPTTADNHTSDGSGTADFTSSLSGLTPGTQYFVRAYATNANGTAYGNTVGFTTGADVPTVTTSPVTILSSTTAAGGGSVTYDGGDPVTARGVCWSTSPNPTTSDGFTTDGTGTGEFASAITGLTPGDFYYIRAYATNSVGTAYGDHVTITATPNLPTVTTAAVTGVTATEAYCGGEVTADGGAAVTDRGVCWDTSPTPTVSSAHTTDGTGTVGGMGA